jgi:hypothetical protein
MPNGFGFGGGWGFGFRGSSPPWPYVGRGRGGLPRCWYFLGVAPSAGQAPYPYYGGVWAAPSYGWPAAAPGATPFAPQMTKEQELAFLKSEAQAVKEQLEEIEAKITELKAE